MSRRFGLLVIALGLAAGLSAEALSDPINRYSRGDAGARHGEAEPPDYHPPEDPATIQNIVERIARALETANNQQKSADDADRAKRDLDAQEDMAGWAEAMFWASVVGLIVTGAGVLLVWRTLIATREAAHYAKIAAEATGEAVGEAKSATRAAEAAVVETRRIGEAQVRAYLHPSNIKLDWEKGLDGPNQSRMKAISVLWENSGHSPARMVSVIVDVRCIANGLIGAPMPMFYEIHAGNRFGNSSIGPGGTLGGETEMVDGDWFLKWVAGEVVILIYSSILYKDVFGDEHRAQTCSAAYFSIKENGQFRVRYNAYPHHNSSD